MRLHNRRGVPGNWWSTDGSGAMSAMGLSRSAPQLPMLRLIEYGLSVSQVAAPSPNRA
jgi:hypothetical protein